MDGLSKVVECLAGLKRDPNNPHHLSALADALQQLFQVGLRPSAYCRAVVASSMLLQNQINACY